MDQVVIYIIKSKLKKDRFYIGSTFKYNHRQFTHFNDLKKNKHHASKLQNHVNKYGIEDIYFEVVEYFDSSVNKDFILSREQYYLDTLKPYFNSAKNAKSNMYGLKHTEESKHKISESGKGRIFTKERNDKISKKLKGRKFDEKWKENISKSAKGRKASETTKKKLSNIHKGKVVSNETRNKLRVNATGNQNMLGKRHTKNTRKLMSEKQKGGGYRTGIPHTNETKEQMMLSRAKFFANKRGVSLEYYMEHHYKKRSKK